MHSETGHGSLPRGPVIPKMVGCIKHVKTPHCAGVSIRKGNPEFSASGLGGSGGQPYMSARHVRGGLRRTSTVAEASASQGFGGWPPPPLRCAKQGALTEQGSMVAESLGTGQGGSTATR
jgi:hypothetical protein